ncbi:MAG TPA: LamG-like jellyroll fold domain-containing protein [Anaerolineales bacterium]|nr:LamG-like jellyroll fold domain-containing protein [Anaerolineales bacterium]
MENIKKHHQRICVSIHFHQDEEATFLGSTTQNWIGRSEYSSDPYLNGAIDEFRIYSRALSAAEVLALFQNP